MKKNILFLVFMNLSYHVILAQPSNDVFITWMEKIRSADSYATSFELEVKDENGDILESVEGEVKKSQDNFFYRIGETEVVLNDSLYISINHDMKIVQCIPRASVAGNINNPMPIPDDEINTLFKKAIVKDINDGWTIQIDTIGNSKQLVYSIGSNYELRHVSYVENENFHVNISYHGFTFHVDPEDGVFDTHRVINKDSSLQSDYKTYQIYKNNSL